MATLVSNNKRRPHRTWHGKRERGDKELTMVLLGRWLWSVLGACARQFQLASHHLHRPFLLRARLPRSTGEFNWEEKLPGASEESSQLGLLARRPVSQQSQPASAGSLQRRGPVALAILIGVCTTRLQSLILFSTISILAHHLESI